MAVVVLTLSWVHCHTDIVRGLIDRTIGGIAYFFGPICSAMGCSHRKWVTFIDTSLAPLAVLWVQFTVTVSLAQLTMSSSLVTDPLVVLMVSWVLLTVSWIVLIKKRVMDYIDRVLSHIDFATS